MRTTTLRIKSKTWRENSMRLTRAENGCMDRSSFCIFAILHITIHVNTAEKKKLDC